MRWRPANFNKTNLSWRPFMAFTNAHLHSQPDSNRKYLYSILILLLMIATFWLHNDAFIADGMEARNLTTAREMLEKGNWFDPTMNGQYRFEKPPLPTWATAFAMALVGQDDMSILRLPAAVSGMLLVFFLFRLTQELTEDTWLPYLAAGTAATSFLIMSSARIISWDIFCHSFMLGAIWQLHKGLKPNSPGLQHFVFSGLLMGLSFLSKGPIAFFVLLLPYLIARFFAVGGYDLNRNGKPLLLMTGITLVLSLAWPLYLYLKYPDVSQYVAHKESGAWVNRHSKAFYYYWSFPVQSGLWAILALASLIAPYARKRIEEFGNYKFLLIWILASVLLMSLFPEKKSRYLLPVMLPLTLLTAFYVRYLIQAYQESRFTQADHIIFTSNNIIIALASLAAPFLLWKSMGKNGFEVSTSFKILSLLTFAGLTFVLGYFTYYKKPLSAWLSIVAGTGLACGLLLSEAPKLVIHNPHYRPYEELRHLDHFEQMPFYASGDLTGKFIEVVWGAGHEIQAWDPKTATLPTHPPLVFFSKEHPNDSLPPSILAQYSVKVIGVFDSSFRKGVYPILRNHVAVIQDKNH